MLRVLLGTDGEAQGAATAADLLGTGFDRQGHADNRQPVVLLLDHQHRFALVTGLWRLGRGAQVEHRNASGNRLVQQAGDVAVGVGVDGQAQHKENTEKTRHGSIQ
ncbi:hypothetical protein D3C84_311510 [compost metagenome]